ncbi:MAG: UDP-N-acetylmuramate dehydrogenase [Luteimonas sp.]|nr:UDP-N-acetylmuramate dehydrogenase [Luteimonas sp.]
MQRAYEVLEKAPLRKRNTFGVSATAPLLYEVADSAVLPELLASTALRTQPLLVLGGGSNLLFAGDPDSVVLSLNSRRINLVADDGDRVVVRADAGVEWHAFVLHTLAQGLCGLENLALIPGTVGAAPIQNIGAYGVEVCDSIHAVDVFDREQGSMRRLHRDDCAFAYRDSLFKRVPDRYVVISVEFALSHTPASRLDYAGLGDELAAMGIAVPSAQQVADAVVNIRRRKLPDPAVIGNAGSFFKNPIVPQAIADVLQAAHPALPMFRGDSNATRKLSAAWLIDSCGWKGHRDGDAGVSDRHALVLVNHGGASGAQLLELARRIAASVHARFDVALEPEPRVIGATW